MPTRRFKFTGRYSITLRDPDMNDIPRRADRRDRGGFDADIFGVESVLWSSVYTIRRSPETKSLESRVAAWDFTDENGVHARIIRIAMVPRDRPQFLQLYIERTG